MFTGLGEDGSRHKGVTCRYRGVRRGAWGQGTGVRSLRTEITESTPRYRVSSTVCGVKDQGRKDEKIGRIGAGGAGEDRNRPVHDIGNSLLFRFRAHAISEILVTKDLFRSA